MLTAAESVEYVATKWSSVAFRSNEPVYLACRLARQDNILR